MTRKIYSSVICLLLVASTLAVTACSNPQPSTTTGNHGVDTTPEGEDVPAEAPNFSELADEQRIVTFAFCEGTNDDWTARSIKIDVDEDPNALNNDVNQKIDARNKTIEAKLGVEIDSYQAGEGIADLESKIGTALSQGEPDYDVVVGYQYYDIIMASKGYVENLANLSDEEGPITYLDYTKSYWGTDYINAITYNNNVYWVTGDLSLRYIGGSYCTFVNSTLYEKYCEEDYGNIYSLVRDRKWTMDLLSEMALRCWEDGAVSGEQDEKAGEGDIVGFAYETCDMIDGMAFGCKATFSKRAGDGSVSVAIASNRNVTFVEKLDAVLHGKNTYMLQEMDNSNVMPFFANGQSLFTVNKIFQAERYLLDMKDDYYIIPTPMLNEAQKEYATGLHDGCSIYGIAYGSDCKRAAAATLEWMAYLSNKDVLPVYYNIALKTKYTNDIASAEMIDLIHEGITTDFGAAWSNSINNMVHWFRTNNRSSRFAETLARQLPTMNASLATLLEELDEYANSDV